MANSAERVTVELIAKVDGFDGKIRQAASSFGSDMNRIRQSADGAEKAVAGSMAKAGLSTKQMTQQSRLLGYQISDIGAQLSVGTSPFVVLAQQGPQVANALEGATGAVGRFAGFLSGPWGAALLAATTILGGFIGRSLEAGDSIDDLVEKLQQQAREAEDAEKANDLFAKTLEGVRKAANDAEDAVEALRLAKKGEAEQTVESIQTSLDNAAALRQEAQDALTAARARLEVDLARKGAGRDTGAAIYAAQLQEVERLEGKLRDAETEAARLGRSLAQAISYQTVDRVNASVEDKINRRFDAQIDRAAQAAGASEAAQRQLAKEIEGINAAREAELKRLRDTDRERRALQRGRSANLPAVTGQEIAAALGTTITSGTRTAAQNRRAGGSKNSYHLSGQAIDIPLTVNGKPLTKAGIRAALEPLGVQIKELLGPGDKDHDDHFHIAFDKKRAGPDEVERSRQKAADELAKLAMREAERERNVAAESESLDDAILRLRQQMATSAEERAALDMQAIDEAQKRYEAEIAHRVAVGDVTEAEAKILSLKNAQIAELDRDLVRQREEQRKRHDALNVATGLLDNHIDVLRSEEDLAVTQKDRRRIALAILDAEHERLRIALEAQIKEAQINGASEETLAVMRQRLANLQTLKAGATEGAMRDTAAPLEDYITGIRDTATAIDEEFEAIAAGSLQSLVDGLGEIATGFSSVGDVALGVLQSITAQLVKLAAQQLILKAIGETIDGTADQAANGAQSAGQAASAGASAATAATVAQAATIAAAWAPAAAAASLASFGANQGPAIQALVTTHALSAALAAAGGVKLARGGPVFGAGTATSDSVPAMLSNGEYVIRASSAAKLGSQVLRQINETGEVPAVRAVGGSIGSISPTNAQVAGGNSGGLSPADLRALGDVVREAAQTMPDVGIYASLDPAEVLDRALGSPAGERRMFAWMGANSGKIKSNLNR
jgi:uncharacterized protein YcbK (DUF882 family)